VRNVLPDHLAPSLDLLLVGINPGLRSAELGHHFAGRGNKFWNLLYESGLVPCRLSYEDDGRLPELGIGLTNIVSRASAGSSELSPRDFRRGRRVLIRKLEKYRPKVAAFVGITVFRELWPALASDPPPRKLACGRWPETIGGSELFVLPNPSGRNAHFTYDEMLREWRRLARLVRRRRRA
jgi:TDG/mug DNA glycosylase family protein